MEWLRTIAACVIVRLKQTKFGKWRYITPIKLMQETDVSEQRYGFREVNTAVSEKTGR